MKTYYSSDLKAFGTLGQIKSILSSGLERAKEHVHLQKMTLKQFSEDELFINCKYIFNTKTSGLNLLEANMVDKMQGELFLFDTQEDKFYCINGEVTNQYEYWGEDTLDPENKVYKAIDEDLFIASTNFSDFYYYGDTDPTEEEGDEEDI